MLLAPGEHGPAEVAATVRGIIGLLSGLLAAKRDEPADDLLSAMIAARDGADRLSEDELLSLAFLILFAGYENSVHVISAAVARLLWDPAAAGAVRAEPDPQTPGMAALVEEARPPPEADPDGRPPASLTRHPGAPTFPDAAFVRLRSRISGL